MHEPIPRGPAKQMDVLKMAKKEGELSDINFDNIERGGIWQDLAHVVTYNSTCMIYI